MTLTIQGYQFGQSNHTVYLLDALHRLHPELLRNDWFLNETFQYHALFGLLTRELMRLNIVQPAFIAGYFALVVLLHWGWWRLVRLLGGDGWTFIASEVIWQLLAAGTALGIYQFLQDSCFLPSNISAVAMLWGIVWWLEDRKFPAGIAFALSAAFHLNYALAAPVLVVALLAWEYWSRRRVGATVALGSAIALLTSMTCIVLALGVVGKRTSGMPLAEFVEIFVRLRHPHHYDPFSWPVWLWVAFLIPVLVWPIVWWRRRSDPAWQSAGVVFAAFAAMIGVALIGAGVVYVSESLVQASLYRFSIFPKLLGCIACAFAMINGWRQDWRQRAARSLALSFGICVIIGCLRHGPYLGLFAVAREEPGYLAACDWIRRNTPVDAVFIVPPDEQEFRLRAQRAVVINFKAVPQLSGELREWRRRMEDVLDMPDIRALPSRSFPNTLAAIKRRYETEAPASLVAAARKYGARYVLTTTLWPREFDPAGVDINNSGWYLYDCSRIP